uniref:Uncharacterized protein n=1 Tax=Molossus molossus TaxID=27622 RepID=A0A7J8J0G6_MOLMO|nr:hypothetical protein HJG59_010385 [Molossus molossus]
MPFPSTISLLHLHTMDSALGCWGLLRQTAHIALGSVPICLNADIFPLVSSVTLLAPVLPVSAPRLCTLRSAGKQRSLAPVDERPPSGSLTPGAANIPGHCRLAPSLCKGMSLHVPEEHLWLQEVVLAAWD